MLQKNLLDNFLLHRLLSHSN